MQSTTKITIRTWAAWLPGLLLGLSCAGEAGDSGEASEASTSDDDTAEPSMQGFELATACTIENNALTGVALTDLARNLVNVVTPNGRHYIRASGRSPMMCITVTGGQLGSGGTERCTDTSFPAPGEIGTSYFEVVAPSSGCLSGIITGSDSCGVAQPQITMPFSIGCSPTYVCGYARPGNGCDSWRTSRSIGADSMAAAISTCSAATPAGYEESCYVLHPAGPSGDDISSCEANGGSWRPANNCCNFNGTLSCGSAPLPPLPPPCQDGQGTTCQKPDGTSGYKLCYGGNWGTCM